jgi:thymidylate synthase
MKQYLDLVKTILTTGVRQKNRTNIDTLMVPGAMLQFDLREGFPALTTKTLFFEKGVVGELLGFLRGYTNAADFRKLGCSIWNVNANKNEAWLANPNRKGEDDLGVIYGAQWVNWEYHTFYDNEGNATKTPKPETPYTVETKGINQVYSVLEKLEKNPTDRRMIVNAWRPDKFDQMALPPCHTLYQFIADQQNKVLHLCMFQRSCDVGLGVPFNIASSALFLTIMAKLSGYTAGNFTHFLADAHIYVNHLEQLEEQLTREPKPLPTLEYNGTTYDGELFDADIFNQIEPHHFKLVGYDHHPAIKLEMAV